MRSMVIAIGLVLLCVGPGLLLLSRYIAMPPWLGGGGWRSMLVPYALIIVGCAMIFIAILCMKGPSRLIRV